MRKLNDKVAWITGAGTGIGAAAVRALVHIIAFIAKMPPHVCINELTVSPTWNRGFVAQAKALTR